jgi:hypothetical protein
MGGGQTTQKGRTSPWRCRIMGEWQSAQTCCIMTNPFNKPSPNRSDADFFCVSDTGSSIDSSGSAGAGCVVPQRTHCVDDASRDRISGIYIDRYNQFVQWI